MVKNLLARYKWQQQLSLPVSSRMIIRGESLRSSLGQPRHAPIGVNAMGRTTVKGNGKDLHYDWKGEFVAIFIAIVVAASFILTGVYWTESQLGRQSPPFAKKQ
jgi:hypothetical protein